VRFGQGVRRAQRLHGGRSPPAAVSDSTQPRGFP
jgi:hypothetical protein